MSDAEKELDQVSVPETVFHSAIAHWWRSKGENKATRTQGGTRDSNLRGDTMDGFRDKLIEVLLTQAGVDRSDIYVGSHLSKCPSNLPSFFRASKNWDVVVCKRALVQQLRSGRYTKAEKLITAVEFKSQYESIGNNQNNRIEESIGNAEDFWASYENGNFVRLTPRPWLGYLFVGKYAEGDETKPVTIKQPVVPSDPAFISGDPDQRFTSTEVVGLSYAERYRIFLERMVAKKKYDSACFLVTHESIKDSPINYRVLFPSLSGAAFVDGLVRHVRAYYPD